MKVMCRNSIIIIFLLLITGCGTGISDKQKSILDEATLMDDQTTILNNDSSHKVISPSPTPTSEPSIEPNPTVTPSTSPEVSEEPTESETGTYYQINTRDIEATTTLQGENNEVTTIIGNGTASQGTYTTEGPRNIEVDNGLIYFIDGKNDNTWIRVFNGKENEHYAQLAGDPVAGKNSDLFIPTGLAVVDRKMFVSSHVRLYLVKEKELKDERYLTHIKTVSNYIDDNGYDYIFRMEEYNNKLYFMLSHKSGGTGYPRYGFVSYDPAKDRVSEVLEIKEYPVSPNNFYVDGDGILLAFHSGVIQYEKFFPRQTIIVEETNRGSFLDAWTTEDGYLHYMILADRVENLIERRHRSEVTSPSLVAGSRRGYVDGIMDQVEMDGATDFIWDGSGYVFADISNHAIRKLWLDAPPTNAVKQIDAREIRSNSGI